MKNQLIGLAIAAASSTSFAQCLPENGRFQKSTLSSANGDIVVVNDNSTGLQWLSCPLGQTSAECVGEATKVTVASIDDDVIAFNDSFTNDIDKQWQVPGYRELLSITDQSCQYGTYTEWFKLSISNNDYDTLVSEHDEFIADVLDAKTDADKQVSKFKQEKDSNDKLKKMYEQYLVTLNDKTLSYPKKQKKLAEIKVQLNKLSDDEFDKTVNTLNAFLWAGNSISNEYQELTSELPFKQSFYTDATKWNGSKGYGHKAITLSTVPRFRASYQHWADPLLAFYTYTSYIQDPIKAATTSWKYDFSSGWVQVDVPPTPHYARLVRPIPTESGN